MWNSDAELRAFLGKMNLDLSAWSTSELAFAEGLAEERLEAACHRRFEIGERTEDYDGTGHAMLPLRGWPITELISVQFIQAEEVFGDFPLASIQVENEIGALVLVNVYGSGETEWPQGERNIRVRYKAGVGTLPKRVVYAAREMVAIHVITGQPHEIEQRGLTSIRIGGRSESYEGVYKRMIAEWKEDIRQAIDSLKGVLIG